MLFVKQPLFFTKDEINIFKALLDYYLVKKDAKSVEPINFTIDNQKIYI